MRKADEGCVGGLFGRSQAWAYCFCWFILQDISKWVVFKMIECLEPAVMDLPCFKKDDAVEKLASRLSALEKAVEDFTKQERPVARAGHGIQ